MKRLFIIVTVLLISISAFSQNYDRAIGIRTGSSIGVSYKHFLSETRAMEGMFDIDVIGKNTSKIKASGYYEFHFDINVDGLSLYAGPGASAGVFVSSVYKNLFVMSVDALAGIEYKFDNAPVILAFDWTPKLQFVSDSGFKPANFAITVRYNF